MHKAALQGICARNALSSDSANALTRVLRQTGKSDPFDLSIAPQNIDEKTK